MMKQNANKSVEIWIHGKNQWVFKDAKSLLSKENIKIYETPYFSAVGYKIKMYNLCFMI